MGKRPHRCYRYLKNKPYPKSKYNRSVPEPKSKVLDAGNKKASPDQLPLTVHLISHERQHLSSESLDAARISANRYLTKNCGKDNYHLRIREFPHSITRINKMLTCAGADRLQTGMRHSWGKSNNCVARIEMEKEVLSVRTKLGMGKHAFEALRRASYKFPGKHEIVLDRNWGFTGVEFDEYVQKRRADKYKFNGDTVLEVPERGSLANVEAIKEKIKLQPAFNYY